MATVPDRDFPNARTFSGRKGVCRRCHVVMDDIEPMSRYGEFWHPKTDKSGKPHWCRNEGKRFDETNTEIEPFLRKGARRRYKRLGIRP